MVPDDPSIGGKADGTEGSRSYEVILTNPHCDECSAADKSWIKANGRLTPRIVQLIDAATERVHVAQFTFSVREIEAALLRAHERGLDVRLAINAAQAERADNVSNRLKNAGVPVKFVQGQSNGSYAGLQHAKFMLVDGKTLLTGSNNWSSTGTTINNENTTIVTGETDDDLIGAFACHFEKMWTDAPGEVGACNVDNLVAFTPGSAAIRMLKDGLRGATTSVDVLMHHLLFSDLQKELAKVAERGVRVRLVINAADREEVRGGGWNRMLEAGVQLRFKRTNGEAYQIMHHKLAIVDGRVLYSGSGNWSGSAFFNNYENYVRYTNPGVVGAYREGFERLWDWSLSAAALDAGLTAAQQHAEAKAIYFGNLHAHFHAGHGRDDGQAKILDEAGEEQHVEVPESTADAAKHAFEYARDRGGLDFLALSPHTTDERADDPADLSNMTESGYAEMLSAVEVINAQGAFLAVPAFEWSTNSSGNHVNVLGSREIAKVERGRFDLLYEDFLPGRAAAGDRPLLMYNHPRTARNNPEYLTGNWDQIFDVPLTDIPNNSQRKKKFNDYGLDDYAPLKDVRQSWIDGEALPSDSVVRETLANIEATTRPYLRLMEVTVGRGKEFGGETPQNPSLSADRETGEIGRYTKVHTDFAYYLLRGFRMAPAANHDNHWANWGTGHTTRTAVMAEHLSEDGLLDAIEQRAVYATEDQNTELRFYAGARTPMGGAMATLEERVTGELFVSDPDHDGRFAVRVFRGRVGGELVEEAQAFEGVPAHDWHSLALDLPAAGEWFFFLEVHDLDQDRMSWTAPIWIQRLQ